VGSLFNKKAADSNKRKDSHLPSRVLQGVQSVVTFGVSKAILSRALQGRKNLAYKSKIPSESDVLKNVRKRYEGKTYPISRFLTSAALPIITGSTVAAFTGLKTLPKYIGMPLAYAAANRETYARSLKGKGAIRKTSRSPAR
jgi:hypothetical protein